MVLRCLRIHSGAHRKLSPTSPEVTGDHPDFTKRVPTPTAPRRRAFRPITGTEGQRLPQWLEPHRDQFTAFVKLTLKAGWETSQEQWKRCQVRLKESGVVLVFEPGRDLPQNASKLDSRKQQRFWEIVERWRLLEQASGFTKSDRSNRNADCVNNR